MMLTVLMVYHRLEKFHVALSILIPVPYSDY